MRKIILFTGIIILFTVKAFAQQYILSGKVTSAQNTPIPFALVYVKNSSYGTTANEIGNYQFRLKPGNYEVIYRMVGYKEHIEKISITGNDEQHNIQMEDEPFKVIIGKVKGDEKYDPALEIMKNVVARRKFYLNEVKSYSSAVYIKGVKIITRSPGNLLAKGVKKILKLDTSHVGISYQSESLSSFDFEQTHKVKEVSEASKFAGNDPPFGYNKASDLQVNFYKDLFTIPDLNSHGFISPLARYSRFYYKYKLLGSVIEEGKHIDKIQVIPRRNNVRAFQGCIYILEDEWRIYSVDLFLTKKENNLTFVDTLKVSQQYIPVTGSTWEPISFQYQYQGSVQGLKFKGYYLGIYNHYKIDTPFAKGYFTGEILHVDTEANSRNLSFWVNVRPVPLTLPEINYYRKTDSIVAIKISVKDQDSIRHANNRFKIFPYLIKGYLSTNITNRDSFYVYPLTRIVYYNTVEGWGLYPKVVFKKYYPDNRSFSISPALRYGFADKLFSANIHSEYIYDQAHAGKFSLNFGNDLLDLNNLGTRSLLFNTLSSLLSEQNFVKYYRSDFAEFGYQRELAKGILWKANMSYANRTQLYNVSYSHIFTYSDVHYSSNNPLAIGAPADDRSELFPPNQALTFSTSLRFTFNQQYLTRPTGKVYIPSLYPVITVNYRKGINAVLGSDVNYDFVSVAIEQDYIPMGLFGHSAFVLKAGYFLNDRSIYYIDYNHFLGNQGTTSDPTYVGTFHFVPFYTFSTKDPFLEVHFQHNFSGAILDNIPIVRNLKLEEIIGANYLTDKSNINYSEFYFGLKRLIYGADYGVSYLGNRKYLQGFRIFIGLK